MDEIKSQSNKKLQKHALMNKIETPSVYTFLAGAEHYVQDKKTQVWKPSDEGVEEMRDFCEENQL